MLRLLLLLMMMSLHATAANDNVHAGGADDVHVMMLMMSMG